MQLLTLNHTQHAVITEEELSKILMNKDIDTRIIHVDKIIRLESRLSTE